MVCFSLAFVKFLKGAFCTKCYEILHRKRENEYIFIRNYLWLKAQISCDSKHKKAFLLLVNKVIVVTNSAPLLVFINICCYFIFLFTTKKFHFFQFIDFLKFLYYIGSKPWRGTCEIFASVLIV